MSRKHKRERDEPFELTRLHIIAGVTIVAVFAGLAIAVFTFFGGADLSKSPERFDVPQPAGSEVEAPRSAAADLLGEKSFTDMTPDEIALVKAEVTRAFDNAQVRTTSAFAPLGIDLFRLDGVTRVVRTYQVAGTPSGKNSLVEAVFFYCDDASGNMNQYRFTQSELGSSANATQIARDQLPFDGTIKALDWSSPEDLGFKTIQGHRVHGVTMPYTIAGSGQVIRAENWFDVETARIIARKAIINENQSSDNVLRTFDWRQPQPIVIPKDRPAAPCSEAFYARLPSARPPLTPTAATDQGGSPTPGA